MISLCGCSVPVFCCFCDCVFWFGYSYGLLWASQLTNFASNFPRCSMFLVVPVYLVIQSCDIIETLKFLLHSSSIAQSRYVQVFADLLSHPPVLRCASTHCIYGGANVCALCTMYPQNLLRAVVAMPKQTCSQDTLLLDLSYITPRIIVAAGPSSDVFLNLFRSPLHKVVDYLNRNYSSESQTHWHMWNLRGEGAGYDSALVDGHWTHHPFPDHMPPTLELMATIVHEIDAFLMKDLRNVALIHCKEGKGRSGTICCAYLMYEARTRGIYLSPEEAMETFTRRRMRRHFGAGVSIRCQVRYLHYWKRYLQLSAAMMANYTLYTVKCPFNDCTSVFTKVTIFGPSLLLVLSRFTLATYADANPGLRIVPVVLRKLKLPSFASTDCYYEIALNVPIRRHMSNVMLLFHKLVCIAYLWLNVYFEMLGQHNRPLPESTDMLAYRRTYTWEDFDGFRGTRCNKVARLYDKLELQWVLHF